MSLFQSGYRLTVYNPRDVDATESSVLTGNGVVHTDPFKVASIAGLSGFQPYLDGKLIGRKNRIDPQTKKCDITSFTLTLLDALVGSTGSNLIRWVSGLLTGANSAASAVGVNQLIGAKCFLEETLDGGATWSAYATCRIVAVREQDNPCLIYLDVRGCMDDVTGMSVFIGRPYSGATYANVCQMWPLGLPSAWGPFNPTTPVQGTLTLDASNAWGYLTPTADTIGSPYNHLVGAVKNLDVPIDPVPRPLPARPGRTVSRQMRARLTVGGVTNEFSVSNIYASTKTTSDGSKTPLFYLVIQPLYDTGLGSAVTLDPFYSALNANGFVNGATVTMSIIAAGQSPTEDFPLLINDIHPVQLFQDILKGYFTYLNTDGTLVRSTPYCAFNAASFSALIADASFPTGRWKITQTETDVLGWIEKNICQPYSLGYYENENGEIVVIDMRVPNGAAIGSLPTISDQNTPSDFTTTVPQYVQQRDGAVTRVQIDYYHDQFYDPAAPRIESGYVTSNVYTNGVYSTDPPVSLIQTAKRIYVDAQNIGRTQLGNGSLEIDGTGIRANPQWVTPLLDPGDQRALKICAECASYYRLPFGTGPATYIWTSARTSVTNALRPGSLALLSHSMLPNPGSNQRGGTRLVRITEWTPNGPTITFGALDMGPNTICAVPTLGTIATMTGNTQNGISIPVTMNASGDPVVVSIAVMPAGTSSAPSATSGYWGHVARATTSTTVTIQGIGSGTRVFVRGRSEPPNGTLRVASAWVTPSTDHIDLSGITAPSGLAVGTITANSARLTWTAGDSVNNIEVWLAHPTGDTMYLVDTIPPGSTRYDITGTTSTNTYDAKIRSTDGMGGYSAFTSVVSWTASGAASACPALPSLTVYAGQ